MRELSNTQYETKIKLYHLLSMAADIYEGNRAKGFWDMPDLYQKMSLISSEVSEALEAARGGLPMMFVTKEDGIQAIVGDSVESCIIGGVFHKPDGFAYELADVAIRCLDFLGSPYANDDNAATTVLNTTICPFYQLKSAALSSAMDCLSLTIQFAESEGLDIVALVKTKLAYNATRPTKHGKKF